MMNRNVLVGIAIHILILIITIQIGVYDYVNAYEFVSAIFGGEGEFEYSLFTNLKLMMFVFFRNSATAALMLATGPFLSLLSIASIAFNGYIIGGVVQYRLVTYGDPFLRILGYLVPHGIVELPVLFYVGGMSFDLGITLITDREALKDKMGRYLNIYLKVILPLLLLAAFIEAFITPLVGSMV